MITSSKEPGQGLVEYALIMLLVAIIVIVALALFGPAVGNLYSTVINSIQHAQAGAIENTRLLLAILQQGV